MKTTRFILRGTFVPEWRKNPSQRWWEFYGPNSATVDPTGQICIPSSAIPDLPKPAPALAPSPFPSIPSSAIPPIPQGPDRFPSGNPVNSLLTTIGKDPRYEKVMRSFTLHRLGDCPKCPFSDPRTIPIAAGVNCGCDGHMQIKKELLLLWKDQKLLPHLQECDFSTCSLRSSKSPTVHQLITPDTARRPNLTL